ncbi:MAG: hypothetical protein H0S80_11515 [Desulfovibrionaceae bacterium]|nr:hypothetical protein [Desulfovibrionaceae bacterium]
MHTQQTRRPKAPDTVRNPRVAVVGSGYWGKNLIQNLHNPGALEILWGKSECVLNGFKRQYPDVECCLALSDTLQSEDEPLKTECALVMGNPARRQGVAVRLRHTARPESALPGLRCATPRRPTG